LEIAYKYVCWCHESFRDGLVAFFFSFFLKDGLTDSEVLASTPRPDWNKMLYRNWEETRYLLPNFILKTFSKFEKALGRRETTNALDSE
jgi:hypothetical protein